MGHLAAARASLDSFGRSFVIAVIKSTLHEVAPGLSDPDSSLDKEENPFSYWRRLDMIRSDLYWSVAPPYSCAVAAELRTRTSYQSLPSQRTW